jgi:hypothetical protein
VTPDGTVTWDELAPDFSGGDGVVGGDGALDGEGTMFVAYVAGDSRVQNPGVRLRCANIAELGGPDPQTVELYATQPGPAPRVISLDPAEFPCDGVWHDRSLNWPEQISQPFAIIAHVSMGSVCPAIYDAITNPIWVAPVTVTLGTDWTLADVDPTPSQRYQFRGSDVIELRFPISMEDQPVDATLYGINSITGQAFGLDGVEGTPADLVPAVEAGVSANGWADSTTGDTPKTRLRLRLPTSPRSRPR